MFFFFSSQVGFYETAVAHADHWQSDNTLRGRAYAGTGPRDHQGAAPQPGSPAVPAGARPPLPRSRLGFQPSELSKLAAGGLAAGSARAAASSPRPPLLCVPRPPPGLVAGGPLPCAADSRGGTRAGPGHRAAEAEPGRPGAATGDPQRCPRPRRPLARAAPLSVGGAAVQAHEGRGRA